MSRSGPKECVGESPLIRRERLPFLFFVPNATGELEDGAKIRGKKEGVQARYEFHVEDEREGLRLTRVNLYRKQVGQPLVVTSPKPRLRRGPDVDVGHLAVTLTSESVGTRSCAFMLSV